MHSVQLIIYWVSLRISLLIFRVTWRRNASSPSLRIGGCSHRSSLRSPLNKEEAVAVATAQIKEGASVINVEYLESASSHHEYREKPLPAWAVSFSNPNCTVYISAEMGTFQTIRHDQWRVFDFLWMFHTMDYAGRDNFNNWLLKILSIGGLCTVISGFVLFTISSPTFRRLADKGIRR